MSKAYTPAPRRKAEATEQNDQNQAPSGTCSAAGCQMPGTIFGGTTGGSEWYCRAHFGATYAEFPDITLRVNNRIGLFRLALRLSNDEPNNPVPAEVADTLRRFGREKFLACKPAIEGGKLSTRTLGAHMLSRLEHECREAEKPQARAPARQEHADTWTSAADAATGAFA
jgi:hypothetical protein